MTTRIAPLSLITIAAALALAGCSSTPVVSGESLASQSATALQESVGSETAPDITCPEDSYDVTEGAVVDCTYYNPDDGSDYPVTVTISEVEGAGFHLGVEIGTEPLN